MNIYIVRHGESETNIHGDFATYTDGDLTKQGEIQSEYCREELKDIKFDKVYSSNLTRANKTAKIVGDTEDVHKFKELTEINGGDYENGDWDEIHKVHEDFYIKLISKLSEMEIPGGESFQDVKERIQRFIDNELKVEEFDENSNILIVSHGVALRVLITLLLEKDDDWVNTTYLADNTAITHIEIKEDSEAKVHKFMSNDHLIRVNMDRSEYEIWSGKDIVRGDYDEKD